MNVRIDALGGIFGTGLATYLVYGQSESCAIGGAMTGSDVHTAEQDASIVGFSLAMALSFTSRLLSWVRMMNRFEIEGISSDRLSYHRL